MAETRRPLLRGWMFSLENSQDAMVIDRQPVGQKTSKNKRVEK